MQFLLNASAEYIPAYVERMYWLEQENLLKDEQAPVKLILKTFLVAVSIFLEDLSQIMQEKGEKGEKTEGYVEQKLFQCLKKRGNFSVLADPNIENIRAAKVHRIRSLYGARVQLAFGSDLDWKGGLWTQSIVKSVSPLLVTVLDNYFSPYNMCVLLNRMLDLMLENGRFLEIRC